MTRRRILTTILFALYWFASPGFVWAQEQKPVLALFCPFASGHEVPGGFSWGLYQNGWKKTLDITVKPWLAWADESGVEVHLIPHCCFGQFDTDMRLDAYDACVAGDFDTITHEFAKSWKPYTAKYRTIFYTGDLDQMPWVPWKDLGSLIQRNLKPYVDAGGACICVDAAGEALNHPATITGVGDFTRSRNGVLLARADKMFGQSSMIEATTHRFPMWEHLHARGVILEEQTWRRRHGLPGERSGTADQKGYGNRDYIKGRVYRIVDTLEDAQRVAREGDVPAVKAWKFVGKHKAREIYNQPVSLTVSSRRCR